jgi:hypothetical protein
MLPKWFVSIGSSMNRLPKWFVLSGFFSGKSLGLTKTG